MGQRLINPKWIELFFKTRTSNNNLTLLWKNEEKTFTFCLIYSRVLSCFVISKKREGVGILFISPSGAAWQGSTANSNNRPNIPELDVTVTIWEVYVKYTLSQKRKIQVATAHVRFSSTPGVNDLMAHATCMAVAMAALLVKPERKLILKCFPAPYVCALTLRIRVWNFQSLRI